MGYFTISARKGAPDDGTDGNWKPITTGRAIRSKQNSDASGMMYQWGRKEPYTFATSSFNNGTHSGKYPVKVYNNKSELIYQKDDGNSNTGMTPVGGIITQNTVAQSMMETIKNPNVYYGINAVISQVSHSTELWNYYWTSYSRGSDGTLNLIGWMNIPTWHNTYLDGYIVLRAKSIYDPCPYGYRTTTNGTYNDFSTNIEWAQYSYTGGLNWNNTWLSAIGGRAPILQFCGDRWLSWMASISNIYSSYLVNNIFTNRSDWSQLRGLSVRCIEDATVKADDTTINSTYRAIVKPILT